ncbi:Repressor CsoR of the copZA operon [hydrothermal vent metagenome]|uniref:Repressor CsoR of the copZA operon n=1 Tax=hydrothermal vent metagenome TaxID=652676 RepID=A0A3B0UNJ0_9ZZZZ|nr:transcriptional regulator [Candidatus Kaiserbacteria bacterium]
MSHIQNKKIIRRLKTVEGQVRGLIRMVEDDTYCIDVITQTTAVRQALSAVEDALLENHLATHVVEQMKSGEHQKAVREILNVYKLSKKK